MFDFCISNEKDAIDDIIYNQLSGSSQLIFKLLKSLNLYDQFKSTLNDTMNICFKSILSKDLKRISEVGDHVFISKIDTFASDFTEIKTQKEQIVKIKKNKIQQIELSAKSAQRRQIYLPITPSNKNNDEISKTKSSFSATHNKQNDLYNSPCVNIKLNLDSEFDLSSNSKSSINLSSNRKVINLQKYSKYGSNFKLARSRSRSSHSKKKHCTLSIEEEPESSAHPSTPDIPFTSRSFVQCSQPNEKTLAKLSYFSNKSTAYCKNNRK